MTGSSSSGSPPRAVQCEPEYPSFGQFGLAEPWSVDGLDFDIERILAGYEAHLAGLMPGQEVGTYLARKLPKKRRRPTTDSPHTSPIHMPQTQTVTPSRLPLGNFRPHMNPEYGDHAELDSLFLEAARLASLEQFTKEKDTLDSANSCAETPIPTTSNGPHPEAHRVARPCSPTPPAEYNAYGCITAHSKGK
ncbi:hypothetical protein FS749_005359, partial [Ceratobasidium sp. UAMH 11750]